MEALPTKGSSWISNATRQMGLAATRLAKSNPKDDKIAQLLSKNGQVGDNNRMNVNSSNPSLGSQYSPTSSQVIPPSPHGFSPIRQAVSVSPLNVSPFLQQPLYNGHPSHQMQQSSTSIPSYQTSNSSYPSPSPLQRIPSHSPYGDYAGVSRTGSMPNVNQMYRSPSQHIPLTAPQNSYIHPPQQHTPIRHQRSYSEITTSSSPRHLENSSPNYNFSRSSIIGPSNINGMTSSLSSSLYPARTLSPSPLLSPHHLSQQVVPPRKNFLFWGNLQFFYFLEIHVLQLFLYFILLFSNFFGAFII